MMKIQNIKFLIIFEKTLEENEDIEDRNEKTQAKIDDDLEQY